MEIAISVIEAAKRVSIGRSSLYKAINRGELKPRKVGGRTLIIVAELEAWVNASPMGKMSPPESASTMRPDTRKG